MNEITVETPWAAPPLTANQRYHWRKKAAITADIRQWARLLFRTTYLQAPITVQLDWHVPDRRRRDVDNAVPTLKAICDGLVDAELVRDDTPDLMVKLMPRIIHSPDSPKRLVLTITGATDD